MLKKFSEYICIQPIYHQHRRTNKAGVSLEITLNVFKCLVVSLVLPKFCILLIALFLLLSVGFQL